MIRQGMLPGDRPREGESRTTSRRSTRASSRSCSKMGISTIQSYRGAQIFEAIGLNQAFVDEYFTWTPSRIGGIGIDEIADGDRAAPRSAPSRSGRCRRTALDPGGQYQWRRDGEYHLFNPQTHPQAAARLPHRRLRGVQGVLARWSTTSRSTLLHAARPAGVQVGPCRRCRSTRSSRSRRSSSASRPARCPTARSARRRTRRWRSR